MPKMSHLQTLAFPVWVRPITSSVKDMSRNSGTILSSFRIFRNWNFNFNEYINKARIILPQFRHREHSWRFSLSVLRQTESCPKFRQPLRRAMPSSMVISIWNGNAIMANPLMQSNSKFGKPNGLWVGMNRTDELHMWNTLTSDESQTQCAFLLRAANWHVRFKKSAWYSIISSQKNP
jgi:hypothetical protein